MSANRTIKSDGNVIIKGLTYPSADGSAGQVIKTDGSGNLSFVDQASGGGGVDTITSASEASSYSGTNKIIQITASTDVIFTVALSDRIIINETSNETNFYANLTNCTVNTKGNIEIRNTSTDGSTDIDVTNCKLMCDTLTVNNSGNTSGNQINLDESSIHARNITFSTQATSSGYYFNKCDVFAGDTLTMPPSGGGNLNIWFSYVNVHEIDGFTNLNATFASTVNVRKGSGSSAQLQIGGTDYLTSAYSYPFRIDKNGVDTKVIVVASTDTARNLSNNTETVIIYEDEEVDTTASYNASTGVFTAPVKGLYAVDASTFIQSTNDFDQGEFFQIRLFKEGTLKYGGALKQSSVTDTVQYTFNSQISATVSLDVGDEIDIRGIQNSGGNKGLSTFSHHSNFFHINKIN